MGTDTSGFLDPHTKALFIVKGGFVAVAALVIAARLFANWRYNRKFLIDDWISIAACLFLISISVLSDFAGNGFHDPSTSPFFVAQLATALSVTSPLALWTCKAPLLFLYIRLFGIKKWLTVASYATLVFTGAVCISGLVAVPPVCTPHSRDISETFINNCQFRTRAINVYLGSVSVLADIIILILPLPVILRLKLLPHSKFGLFVVFLTGILAIVASAVSLRYKSLSLILPETSLAISMLATVVECSIAVIVGCIPALRVMWSKGIKSGKYTEDITELTEPTRTNRMTGNYIVMGDGTDQHSTSDLAGIRTEVTITKTYDTRHTPAQLSISSLQDQPFYGQSPQRQKSTHLRNDNALHPQEFGVFSEAYTLNTKDYSV
ncbi:hypothetical protein F5Y16DRAFT_79189 [Xylariaceae sp. FL0255]|nr:hypothetical protein F5Y16DRAFT_79189 [Xylariaceae sp. FL0255]